MKTFIDLFAGIGGFHVALAERGLECVFASEIDSHAADSYEANFGMRPRGDITKIANEDIPPHDVLCAGFPCQPFSQTGSRKGLDDVRGGLFYEIVRIAKHHQPKVLILENVKRILTIDKGNVWRVIQDSLEEAGYYVDHSVLNAGDFGVPQQRERAFIVAIRKDLSLVYTQPMPLPPAEQKCVFDIAMDNEDVQEQIIQRPDIIFKKTDYQGRCYKLNEIGCVGENSRVNSIQGYRIFDGWGLACTQTANGGGCQGGARTGIYLINGDVRVLHIDEAKQVMGFPATHVVADGREGFRQTGNSVVPAVVGHVFDAIKGGE